MNLHLHQINDVCKWVIEFIVIQLSVLEEVSMAMIMNFIFFKHDFSRCDLLNSVLNNLQYRILD